MFWIGVEEDACSLRLNVSHSWNGMGGVRGVMLHPRGVKRTIFAGGTATWDPPTSTTECSCAPDVTIGSTVTAGTSRSTTRRCGSSHPAPSTPPAPPESADDNASTSSPKRRRCCAVSADEAGVGKATVGAVGVGEATSGAAGVGAATVDVAGGGEATVAVAGGGEATIDVAGGGEATVDVAGSPEVGTSSSGDGRELERSRLGATGFNVRPRGTNRETTDSYSGENPLVLTYISARQPNPGLATPRRSDLRAYAIGASSPGPLTRLRPACLAR